MRLSILTMKPNSHFVTSVRYAAERRDVDTDVIDLRRLLVRADDDVRLIVDGKDITRVYDVCLARPLGKPTVSEFMFNISILEIFRASRANVVNKPEAYINTCNKVLAYAKMAEAGLPIPRTIASRDLEVIRNSCNLLGERAILKPACGSRGRGVKYLSNLAETSAVELPVICQRFVRGSDYDIRAFVVGEEVVAGMARRSGSVATNLSRGGEPSPLKLTEEQKELAIKASVALGCEIAGVDIAEDRDGREYLLEVNSQPDFIGLQRVADTDVADRVVTFMREKAVR
jgi:RimK family alpha-L-glutamate ligase